MEGGACAAIEESLSKGDKFCTPRLTSNIWKFCLVAASGGPGHRRANRDMGATTAGWAVTASGRFCTVENMQECHREFNKFELIATKWQMTAVVIHLAVIDKQQQNSVAYRNYKGAHSFIKEM